MATKLIRSTLRLAVVTLTLAAVAACSWDSGTTPRDTYSDHVSILERPALGKATLAEAETLADSAIATQTGGAVLSVGDDEIGRSSLDVPADAVDGETRVSMVKMRVTRLGQVTAELGPPGTWFVTPVWVTLSYRGADLTGVDESRLAIFYLNEELPEPVWELVDGSVVNMANKTVSAPLMHFSRYGIGSDE